MNSIIRLCHIYSQKHWRAAFTEKLKENIEAPMFRRTALEAQLSHVLTGQGQDEVRIRELCYQLNEARVQRRIHDYLSANISLDKKE